MAFDPTPEVRKAFWWFVAITATIGLALIYWIARE
jgi:hypothetical protein